MKLRIIKFGNRNHTAIIRPKNAILDISFQDFQAINNIFAIVLKYLNREVQIYKVSMRVVSSLMFGLQCHLERSFIFDCRCSLRKDFTKFENLSGFRAKNNSSNSISGAQEQFRPMRSEHIFSLNSDKCMSRSKPGGPVSTK